MKNTLLAAASIVLVSNHAIASGSKQIEVTVDNMAVAHTNMEMVRLQEEYGINQMMFIPRMAQLDFQPIIRMNQDTIYSGMVMNVSEGATITLPEMDGRYASIQVHDQNHWVPLFTYESGTHEIVSDTDYVVVVVRIQADESDPSDIAKAAEWQSKITWTAGSNEPLKLKNWDMDSYQATVADLRTTQFDYTPLEFMGDGTPGSSEVRAHATAAYGGFLTAPAHHAFYGIAEGNDVQSCTPVTFDVPDINPDRGFYSVTLYNGDGYFAHNKASLNSDNLVLKKGGDTYTIHFGNECGNVENNIPTTENWNLIKRVYRATPEQLENSYVMPEIL
ncbi:DUF1254 domain-containing protein [Vibrio lamellibrachiae]|uniref:DUF1254 domain-containing protein n=1 Tax=Vibrio lamellibrachiae TaxID=2910253 RepID=UPI003D13913D